MLDLDFSANIRILNNMNKEFGFYLKLISFFKTSSSHFKIYEGLRKQASEARGS